MLVTGANRGIGRGIVEAALAAGARKVWAASRNVETTRDLVSAHPGRVAALKLDVTNLLDVENAARTATDVEVLVNNAGAVAHFGGEAGDATWLRAGREEMEVNVFGPLALTQAFAPVLARNGGGAIVNLVSVAGLVNFPVILSYSLSKAALHSLSQAFRALLKPQGTQVFAVYPGPVDTEMAARFPMEKASPSAVAQAILTGLGAGEEDIFPDPFARQFGATFLADPKRVERELATAAA